MFITILKFNHTDHTQGSGGNLTHFNAHGQGTMGYDTTGGLLL